MAIFQNMLITHSGQSLYNKAQAGIPINFTKMKIGSGKLSEGQDSTNFTKLINYKFDVSISSITQNTQLQVAIINGTINNDNIIEGTYICELGLFANDPDAGEILYAYVTAGTQGDYIAPNSKGSFAWNYQISAAIGNASDVTATVSSTTFDYAVANSENKFSIISGANQKEVNKSIDNCIKLIKNTVNFEDFTLLATQDDTHTFQISVPYNPITDHIELFYKGVTLEDVNYTLNGTEVTLSDWSIKKSEKITGRVWKFVNNIPIMADGSNIQDNSIAKRSLTADIQENLNKITDIQENLNKMADAITEKYATKTSNAPIISLPNSVNGMMDVELQGNTVDIYKDPITSDFKGKICGSVVENPNIAKRTQGDGSQTLLLKPSEFPIEIGLNDEKGISAIANLDTICSDIYTHVKDAIPQQLFSFNIIEEIKRKYGLTLTVEQAKQQIESIKCNWYGYGSCPSGNKAYLDEFDTLNNTWYLKAYGNSGAKNTSNTPTLIQYGQITSQNNAQFITSDGFVHFVAYTDASDGVTASTINTDTVNIEIQLKPKYESVGEKQVDGQYKIEVLSRGKNLFDGTYLEGFIDGGSTTGVFIPSVGFRTTNYIRIKPNTAYTIQNENREVFNFYDINKIHISNNMDGKTKISPNNAHFVKVYYYNPSDVTTVCDISKIQLEEGTTATPYEPYKEDKVNNLTQDELRGLPNGTRDTASGDAVTRKVRKVVLNGKMTENWRIIPNNNRQEYFLTITDAKYFIFSTILADKLLVYTELAGWLNTQLGICLYNGALVIVNNNITSVENLRAWLQTNNLTVYYELATPIIEKLPQPITLESFKNGSLEVNTTISPYTTVKYPLNIGGAVSSIADTLNTVEDRTEKLEEGLLVTTIKTIENENNIKSLSVKVNDILKQIDKINGQLKI